jgi:hypothetical protein
MSFRLHSMSDMEKSGFVFQWQERV